MFKFVNSVQLSLLNIRRQVPTQHPFMSTQLFKFSMNSQFSLNLSPPIVFLILLNGISILLIACVQKLSHP